MERLKELVPVVGLFAVLATLTGWFLSDISGRVNTVSGQYQADFRALSTKIDSENLDGVKKLYELELKLVPLSALEEKVKNLDEVLKKQRR